MANDRSLVRASDVGLWVMCQRAWWLARVQGVPHQQPTRLAWGQSAHDAHSRQVQRARQLHRLGWLLLILSLGLMIGLLLWWLGLRGFDGR
jgi:hypothetical protein